MITDKFTHSLSQKCTKSFLLGISIYSLHSKIADILSLDKKLEVEKCGAQKNKKRDREALKKEKKCVLREEKCSLKSENENYFDTKFESNNVNHFGTE
jgi:hypothetical protein